MTACPTCGQPLPDAHAVRDLPDASDTGDVQDESQTRRDWVSVGRFKNLAEVGYFSDRFAAHEIPSQTRQHDEFRATDGSWRSIYVLQVPEELASVAADLIRSEIAEDDAKEDDESWSDDDSPAPAAVAPNRLAQSALLVVVVGGLAYLAGRAAIDQPAAVAPGRPTLWQTLAEIEGPLTTDSAAVRTPHRVRFDSASDAVVIERDADRDGRFEQWRVYEQGQLESD